MTEPKVDPADEALRLADEARQWNGEIQEGQAQIALAQVYASLFVGEQVKRVADALEKQGPSTCGHGNVGICMLCVRDMGLLGSKP